MTTRKWTAPSTTPTSALTTELNSLANGSYSDASAAINNTSNLHNRIALQLHLGSLTPTAGGYVAVYAVRSWDVGTTFVDGGGSTAPPAGTRIAVFDLSTSTGAKERDAVAEIDPCQFKLVLQNQAGVALNASGNTLKYVTYTEQDV